MPFIAEYKLCSTPKVQTSIGTTMAYSAYAEIGFTALFVVLLTKMGILSMKKKVSLSAIMDEEFSLDDAEEMRKEIAELRASLQIGRAHV